MATRPARTLRGSLASTALLAALVLKAPAALALNVQYCSNLNTGSQFSAVTDMYQSNGACHNTCSSQYAFAVLQGNHCWCSNYVPGQTASTGDCNSPCPGYPDDKCGSTSQQLFGYIALNRQPSGTQGASTSSSTTSTSTTSTSTTPTTTSTSTTPTTTSTTSTSTTPTISSTDPGSVTFFRTITDQPKDTKTSSTSPTTPTRRRTTPITSTTSTSKKLTSTWTPTPVTSVMTVTGSLQTVTITPTDPPKAVAPIEQSKNGFFQSPGKVAGLFVGLAIIVLLVAGAVLFFLWRRYQQRAGRSAAAAADPSDGGPSPMRSRTRSMSQLGLISRNSTLMGERSLPPLQTGFGAGALAGAAAITPTSPLDRRASNARVVDQRLDPGTIWNPLHDNSSRVSVRSLQDDQDYSRRVLKLANPDHPSP